MGYKGHHHIWVCDICGVEGHFPESAIPAKWFYYAGKAFCPSCLRYVGRAFADRIGAEIPEDI